MLSLRLPSFRLPQLGRHRRSEPAAPDPGPVLVLSGGARMGAVQVGILRSLSATGFRPAAVVGTSTGAFNASFLAFHPEDERHAQLREVWAGLQFHRIFNRNPLRMAYNAAVRRDHVYSNTELRDLIVRHVRPDEIASAAIPLRIVASNLGTGEKTVFSSGSVLRAVLASAAIPGFFPPVEINGELYVDGAVTANLDLDTAVAFGAHHIVAVDVSASVVPTQARTIGAVLARSLEIVMRERTFGTLERLEPRARITLLRPGPLAMRQLGGIASMTELLEAADRLGEDLVARALDPQGGLAHGLISTEPLAPLPELAPIG
jgi:NTE family protein